MEARTRRGALAGALLALVLVLGAASPAQAEDCSEFPGGLIDGATGTPPPSQIQIDTNCTIRNYPASSPLTTNFSFLTQPGQTEERWLIVFDNVVHTGQMACNSVAGHKIWFVNGSSSSIQEGCQNLLIPVEKIDKQNPAGQTTAAIGVPFTYTLTIPVLFDPATGSVINASGSPNDLHSVIVTDDLNATGVDLTYLGHVAYWRDTGTPVAHSFSNVGGVLTFDVTPVIPASEQIVIELTVVLEDTATNAPNTQFINTAKWEFGRLIDGVFYQPLPGEWGISEPLTIAAPELVVTKTGPATLGRTLNLGEWGQFAIDVENTGQSDAWDVTIVDRFPDGSTGGMCDTTPEVLSVQVFDAGGAPVSGALDEGSDFSLSYDPASCELTLTMLSSAGTIGAGEHLVISYRSKLDADSQDGVMLTNVAGATEWFNGDGSNPDRVVFQRTVTDGTVGVPDHQDAHTVTVALHGYFFEKSVANLTTGANPTTTAAPGDRLRYTLRLQATDVPLDDVAFFDDLGALNSVQVFEPGSLQLVPGSLPPGADASNTLPGGGPLGEGILDVRSLSVPALSEITLQFDVTVDAGVTAGTLALNQAILISTGTQIALSDDPNVNGQADPDVVGDEDPTRVLIQTTPPGTYLFEKTVANLTSGADPATTAAPGDRLRYRLRLENVGSVPLSDVALFDELDRLNATAAFQPGTLQLVSVPAGADASNTSSTGGSQGTGVLDVRNLGIAPGESLQVELEIELQPVLANGSLVLNQAQLLSQGVPFADSDDPNVNGPSDPTVSGDEDPTQVRIESAPAFRVEKVSSYTTGDPNVLLAGETLRYTITVENVGTDDAQGVELRDEIPVNTQYVAGSTTLNGTAVPDGPGGLAPLVDGILIHAPADPTAGVLPANAPPTPDNVATIVFDVVVDPDVIDGTVISNQAFVTTTTAGVPEQPSDDPRTPLADDPTRDVVGPVPLLFAAKDVELLTDAGSPGIVDPGDVLLYTITVTNSGNTPATGVVLTDDVPANTTYVADSLTLNGLPVGRPDGGVSPLIAGLPISSTGLTPPLPGPGQGTLAAGGTARIEFSLRVDVGVPAGTVISNQAVVTSLELPSVLTDGDGNPATGPEPTVVVVGDGQQLSISKQVLVVGGGAALPGKQLEYVVRVVNVGSVPAFAVVVTDDLAPTSGLISYVDLSATLNGSSSGVGLLGSVLTADYSALNGPLQPGDSIVLRFRAVIDAGLTTGTILNTAVVTWSTPSQTASASVAIDVGGMPGVGALGGTLWHDADFDDARSLGEQVLEGWTVELRRNGQPVQSVLSDAGGAYRFGGLEPNDVSGDRYEIRFRAPGAGASSASLGEAASPFTDGPQRISDIVVASGGNLQDLHLPIDPNGVVYDAIRRVPIAGAALSLLDATSGTPLPASCFVDPVQQGQVTLQGGHYKFDLDFSDPACPSGGSYRIAVAAPGSGYGSAPSQILPPTSDAATPAFSVPTCPGGAGDAVPSTPDHCEAQLLASAPTGAASTTYHLHLLFDDSRIPGSSQIFNNHLPLDPTLDGALGISKTTSSVLVSRGQLVPYEITYSSELALDPLDVRIIDRFPAGFRYVEGSARIGGVPVEPTVNGQELVFTDPGAGTSSTRTLVLLLAVGSGVGEGEYVNRAWVMSNLTGERSGEATATVRVVPDPTFSCTDVLGKVYDDTNRNGVQDAEERGLPGVRLVTARGLVATTDAHGRYHITCAVTPRDGRGSNFILKLDDRTLPTGYRMATRRVQVQRATPGKALRLNYAASIHRVVGLDMADPVFEPGSVEMRAQWRPRLDRLLEELQKGPSILRLSYLADVEDAELVERRLDTVEQQLREAWQALDCCNPLTIEPAVFWLRGAPPDPAPASGSEER